MLSTFFILLACSENGIRAFDSEISIVPVVYDFGVVPFGEEMTHRFAVNNIGRGTLQVEDIVASDPESWVTEMENTTIRPGGAEPLFITYMSAVETLNRGRVSVFSNDPTKEEIQIELMAGRAEPIAKIQNPVNGDVFDTRAFDFEGEVSDEDDGAPALAILWESSLDGLINGDDSDEFGRLRFTRSLSPGAHTITLSAADPDGSVATDSVAVEVCPWLNPVTFSDPLEETDWTLSGTAHRDEAGFLELTGLVQHATGGAFRASSPVSTYNLDVSMLFQTGGGEGSGADGFSFTVAREDSPSLLGDAGGCLGYGAGDGCSSANGTAITGIHVEIDTYPNPWDPSPDTHLAVTLDGDQSSYALADVIGSIEDSEWHTLRVRLEAPRVQVWLDDEQRIDGEVPGFEDFTGYVGFTASTGDDTNVHRIDDLEVDNGCPSI